MAAADGSISVCGRWQQQQIVAVYLAALASINEWLHSSKDLVDLLLTVTHDQHTISTGTCLLNKASDRKHEWAHSHKASDRKHEWAHSHKASDRKHEWAHSHKASDRLLTAMQHELVLNMVQFGSCG